MMKKNNPALVILAAGMGSRYGGLKQMDPVDALGHMIIDYSIYDAKRAGFSDVVCIIKHEIEKTFFERVGDRLAKKVRVTTAYQELSMLPDGFALPEGRVKPWGTGHALLCASEAITGPFAVINADDYYGPKSFERMYAYLCGEHAPGEYAMLGYPIEKTLTENGTVTRGVCALDACGYLQHIHETRGIYPKAGGGAYIDQAGEEKNLPAGTPVSMNFWGFDTSILHTLREGFPDFLQREGKHDPLKCEYLLPAVVEELVREKKASVVSLEAEDQWFGVTYQADMPVVQESIRQLQRTGLYPEKLWE